MIKLKRTLSRMSMIVCVCVLSSCSHDPEVNVPSKPNVKILILGNSILWNSPDSSLGWYGDWGMAATTADKDFKSVYLKKMQDSYKFNLIKLDSKNIAFWENDLNYDLNNYSDVSSQSYDVLIIRLGENVSDLNNYESSLISMINHFKNINTKVLITGVIWESNEKENIHKSVALANNYRFIPMEDFRNNILNYSWGKFENSAVAAHPSDFGMNSIAALLYINTLQVLHAN